MAKDTLRARVLYALFRIGWTQTDLALVLGLSSGNVNRLLAQDTSNKTDTIKALAKHLDVDWTWLAGDEEKAPAPLIYSEWLKAHKARPTKARQPKSARAGRGKRDVATEKKRGA